MDNDPKKNDDDLYPNVERIKKLVHPDDTPVRPEQLSNLAQRAVFQSNDAEDLPTPENTIFIPARPHIKFLKDATGLIGSGTTTHFREPENLKQFRAAEDYAVGGERHADKVQAAWDEFVQRLKAREDEKNAYLKSTGSTKESAWLKGFLKAIDEYVDNSAPKFTEDQFHTSWGTDKDDIVGNVNRFYGVITVDGKTTIYHTLPEGKFEFIGKESFDIKFCKWNIMDGTKLVGINKVWLNHPKRRDIDKIIFDARYTGNSPRIVNQWHDFPTVARQGNCEKILAYYKDVASCGIDELYNLVLDYLAHLIQKPWEKPEFAIVLVGLKGIGKTKFVQIVQHLIGKEYCFQTSNPDDIYGRFKKHLMNKLVVMLEEMTWGGDKRKEGMLQDLITGRTLNIEIKHGPTITVDNQLRTIIDSNSPWVVPTSHDERRFAVLKVSEAQQLIQIAQKNTQVAWIMGDIDVSAFYTKLLNEHSNNISIESVKTLTTLLSEEEKKKEATELEDDIPF